MLGFEREARMAERFAAQIQCLSRPLDPSQSAGGMFLLSEPRFAPGEVGHGALYSEPEFRCVVRFARSSGRGLSHRCRTQASDSPAVKAAASVMMVRFMWESLLVRWHFQ